MLPTVLHEDNHLIVVFKPFCMPSQGDPSGDLSLLEWTREYIRQKYNKPGNVFLSLIHRIDRPVGGIMVFGKTSKATPRLSRLFHDKKVEKTYYALCEGIPDEKEGTLVHFLKQLPGKNIMRAYNKEVRGSKRCELEYAVTKIVGVRSLIEIRPKTGRKHQIRVQLASIGCTIVGDKKYGNTRFLPDKSIRLISQKLAFVHPVKKERMEWEVSIPENWFA